MSLEEFIGAAKEGDIEALRDFCETQAHDSLRQFFGRFDEQKQPLVLAARGGQLDVVKFLVSVGDDPSCQGTVDFDGETIHGAPPLWAAAAAGFMDIVKYLVEEAKVDINQTTHTNSTPLRGACYDGHIEIVKYLIENGANFEIANRHGHTPLMIASYRKKKDVVEYLLSKGANPLAASRKGNTALHDAAEASAEDICELLLQAGAKLATDEIGVCPLISAALLGHEEVVNVLLPHCDSRRRRRDAVKLLGATFIDKRSDSAKALQAWALALSIDLGDEEEAERQAAESRAQTVPAVYGYKEIETEQDWHRMVDGIDPDVFKMQALIIRERILTGAHQEVHYYLRYRGAVYCDSGLMSRCYDLWLHALNLQQKYLQPLNQQTMQTLLAFQETFTLVIDEHTNVQPVAKELGDQVAIIYEKAVDEIERLVAWGSKPLFEECSGEDHEHNIDEEKENLLFIILQLLFLVHRAALPPTYVTVERDEILAKEREAFVDVERLVNVCREIGLFPLHLACTSNESQERRGFNEFYSMFPQQYVVERLVEAGSRLDEVDGPTRETPLHRLITSDSYPDGHWQIARYLLQQGAPALARNADNKTCLELIQKHMTLLLENYNAGNLITLAGLAANAVRRAEIPYEELVPRELLAMMKLH